MVVGGKGADTGIKVKGVFGGEYELSCVRRDVD